MAHVAMALTRRGGSWRAWELELGTDDDLESLGEQAAESIETGDAALLLVEENDEWFAIARWSDPDPAVDPQVFLSDRRVLATSELAARLFADELVLVSEDDSDEDSGRPELEPAGDPGLLADLGTAGDQLMELTVAEGLLPADALAAVAEAAGAADVFEAARG